MARASIPTLIIYGTHDFIPREISEHIRRAMPNAELLSLSDCGHFAHLECPDAARAGVARFLGRTSK